MTPSQPCLDPVPCPAPRPRQRLARLSALAALVALGFPLAQNVDGYALESGAPRWPSGTVTFVLSLGSGTRSLSDGSASFDAAAFPALNTWNQYMGSLQLNIVTNDGTPVAQNDGVNSVAFATSFFGQSFGSNTLAITGYYYGGGRMTEANVLVNSRWTWDSYRGPLRSAMDIRRVLIHEVGHALGLDHPDQHGQNVAAVMNSIVSNIDTAVTDDINGIQSIYGARTGGGSTPTPTPTPIATPRPTATPTPTPFPTPNPTPTPVTRFATIAAAPTFLHVGDSSTLTVSLSSASSAPVTVNYFVSGGGRARRVRASFYDISGTPGQVTIPAGATSANFSLTATSAGRRSKAVSIYLTGGIGYNISSAGRGVTILISP